MNAKKVRRLWREEGLKVPQRVPRLRRRGPAPEHPVTAAAVNDVWTWDFVSETTEDGRQVRILSILDEYNTNRPHSSLNYQTPAAIVAAGIREELPTPEALRSDENEPILAPRLGHGNSPPPTTS